MPGELLLFEHVNVGISSEVEALRLLSALGCVRSDRTIGSTLHVNCGAVTQFHLPVDDEQVWRGVVEVGYANEEDKNAALEKAVGVGYEKNGGSSVRLDGMVIILSVAKRPEAFLGAGRRRGAETGPGRPVGILSCTVEIPRGTSNAVAEFYEQIFHFTPVVAPGCCTLPAGPAHVQSVVFTEVDSPRPYSGEHFCLYISNLKAAYRNCEKHGITWVNPRFLHMETARTEEEAVATQGFRALDVIDIKTKNKIIELEHEVRGLEHPLYPYGAAETA